MEWYNKLYISPSAKKKSRRIIWKIKHKAGTIGIYIITIASNKQNLLDIIPANDVMFLQYPRRDVYVIGIAKGYNEAIELATSIVQEVYEKTGGFDVRAFFSDGSRRRSI